MLVFLVELHYIVFIECDNSKRFCETHNTQETKIEIDPNLAIQGTLRMQILGGP